MRCPTCKQQCAVPKAASGAGASPLPTQAQVDGSSAAPPVIAPPSAAPPIIGAGGELERQVLEGGRFVVFQYCFSVVVMTFRRASPVMFLRGDEDGVGPALNYSLISLAAGWWGIPWGPIWTIATVISNLGGGKDLTQAVLAQKLGPARAAQIMAQRRRPSPKGGGLKRLRWGLAGAGMVLAFAAVMALMFAAVTGGPNESGRAGGQVEGRRAGGPGEAQFTLANRQIEMNRGNAAFGNSPKAVMVAERFSSNMKKLRGVLFQGGKQEGLSLSHHEFLTCCELQETQCALIVHVPELRRFTDSAKASLGTLAWFTAQQALQGEGVGRPGMKVAVGLRGIVLYDRVLMGTFTPDLSGSTNGPSETITGSHPEERLFPWFQSAEAPTPPVEN